MGGVPASGAHAASRASRVAVAVIAVVAGLAASAAVRAVLDVPVLSQVVGMDGVMDAAAVPPVPDDAADSRLLPVVAPVLDGPHALLHAGDGAGRAVPVGYDPCRPVHWVVNATGAPAGSEGVVAEAVAAVSAATGLVFVADGSTDEVPAEVRDVVQPDRYGQRWAPVLVGWADERSYPELAGAVAGRGGSPVVAPSGPGSERLVAGSIVLDADDAAATLAVPGGRDLVRATVMHELGHVVGLDHVDDPAQLMAGANAGLTTFGPGDLAGLARLGNARCHTDA